MSRTTLFLSALILGVHAILNNTAIKPSDYDHSSNQGQVTVYWTVESKENTISIGLVGQTTGWVAVGFGGSMSSADIYAGYVTNGVVTINDYFSTAEATPSVDTAAGGTNSILEYAGIEVAGATHIKFRRLLDTKDAKDKVITTSGSTPVIVAIGAADGFAKHSDKSAGQINFIGGSSSSSGISVSNPGTFLLAHSAMMVLGWAFFATAGIFIARFGHGHEKWWFKLHIASMTVAVVFVIIGFILAIFGASAQFSQTVSVSLAHAWIGLFVVIGAISQPVIGFLADRAYDPNRTEIPLWPDKIHWLVGRYAYVGAMFNILLGLCAFGSSQAYFVLYGIWVVICAVGYHFMDYAKLPIVEKIKGDSSGLPNSNIYVK